MLFDLPIRTCEYFTIQAENVFYEAFVVLLQSLKMPVSLFINRYQFIHISHLNIYFHVGIITETQALPNNGWQQKKIGPKINPLNFVIGKYWRVKQARFCTLPSIYIDLFVLSVEKVWQF